jgi:hypothetical protein
VRQCGERGAPFGEDHGEPIGNDGQESVGRVLMELGLSDRVQAVIFAYESGVVTIGHNRRPAGSRRERRAP